ncbi:unnamed protein product [Candida verbasci]|uniref:Uncharacterized protein n=1 Tax=Candida verbasci TaxID=1227364 RepID=A0A9W4XC68_9ASCO|nr:unnamed protein product [Candida verbasci]
MRPSIIRAQQQALKNMIVPQYKYYIKRIPQVGIWFGSLMAFLTWPHLWAEVSNVMNNAPGNRGLFYVTREEMLGGDKHKH